MKINRKKLFPLIAVLVLFIAQLACDEQPVCTNACGITSPVTNVESVIMDAVTVEQQNTLSGGN